MGGNKPNSASNGGITNKFVVVNQNPKGNWAPIHFHEKINKGDNTAMGIGPPLGSAMRGIKV